LAIFFTTLAGGVVYFVLIQKFNMPHSSPRRSLSPINQAGATPIIPSKDQSSPANVPTVATKTTGWKTYHSQKYGFTIQYPPDWKVNEIPVEQRNQFAPIIALKSDSGAKILIIPKGEYDYGLPFSTPREENIVINGHAASRTEWVLENGERLVRIGFYDWNPSNRIELQTSPQGDTEAQLEEMNRIVSTFKLL
jgi:hypothetical protein